MSDVDYDAQAEEEIDLAFIEGLRPEHEAARLGQLVDDDIAEHGALSGYIVEVRARCVAALRKFTMIDIEDRAALRDCQDAVRHYVDLMDYVRRALVSAQRANVVLARETGSHEVNGEALD